MQIRHRLSYIAPFLAFITVFSLLMAACGSNSTTTGASSSSSSSTSLTAVSIGLGYVPDIQFAPFYVAQAKGYYKAAGLDVTFHHGIVPDLIGSMIAGKNTFVFAGGDEELEAMSANSSVKVIDIGTIFQKYPVSLIVPANSSIKTLADLKGHTIGVPGLYGSTYTGLLGLLYSAHLSTSDVKLESIGFTQVAALLTHKVDAVVGYSNNEPLQLQEHGMPVRTFDVSNYQPLVSNGIITTDATYQSQPKMVCGFVQATLKGVQEVISNPSEALTISESYVPGMNTAQAAKVLQATIPIWQSNNGQLGYNDSATWQAMEQFLVAQKIIKPVANLSQVYTNQCLAG
jgi:NitT/TauT family transport system substrate-binding protein